MSLLDSNWDCDKLEQGALAGSVRLIHLVAYRNESNKGDGEGMPATNHWCTFLELSDRTSVRLDMMPGYGNDGLQGKIEISSKKYSCTNSSIKVLTFTTTRGVTVQKIVDLISLKGRQKYQFTPEWEGCRYWNLILVQDLEAAGYIDGGSAEAAMPALSSYWVFPRGQEMRAIRKGTFR